MGVARSPAPSRGKEAAEGALLLALSSGIDPDASCVSWPHCQPTGGMPAGDIEAEGGTLAPVDLDPDPGLVHRRRRPPGSSPATASSAGPKSRCGVAISSPIVPPEATRQLKGPHGRGVAADNGVESTGPAPASASPHSPPAPAAFPSTGLSVNLPGVADPGGHCGPRTERAPARSPIQGDGETPGGGVAAEAEAGPFPHVPAAVKNDAPDDTEERPPVDR